MLSLCLALFAAPASASRSSCVPSRSCRLLVSPLLSEIWYVVTTCACQLLLPSALGFPSTGSKERTSSRGITRHGMRSKSRNSCSVVAVRAKTSSSPPTSTYLLGGREEREAASGEVRMAWRGDDSVQEAASACASSHGFVHRGVQCRLGRLTRSVEARNERTRSPSRAAASQCRFGSPCPGRRPAARTCLSGYGAEQRQSLYPSTEQRKTDCVTQLLPVQRLSRGARGEQRTDEQRGPLLQPFLQHRLVARRLLLAQLLQERLRGRRRGGQEASERR